MDKVLISWIAVKHDFKANDEGGLNVNREGTTLSFHKYFYKNKYRKHIILSAKKGNDNRLDFLANAIGHEYPMHQVEPRCLGVTDVISLEQIKAKIEPLLFEFRADEIDIFISPGTPAMQTAWVLAHMTLGLKTNLIQVRPKQHTLKREKPELIEVSIDKDTTTSSAIILETTQNRGKKYYSSFLETESIKPVYRRAKKIAQASNSTVLVLGETGTGKEHLAKFIHDQSPRRNASFFAVNCSAMGDQLLESRLFGYKKGAFTGADKDMIGLIELADGGTVFLDEIGDISSYMQQLLLRLIQEKEITPIGGKSKKIDVRFISATNKDLIKLCEQNKFRWDLFYRLSVVDLELPSIRERGLKEIKELINFFLKEKKKLFNSPKLLKIPKAILDKILAYSFPGNVRELENLIERLYVVQDNNQIKISDLPKRMLIIDKTTSLKLKDVEQQHITKVLKLNNGALKKTARDIGITFNTLKSKILKYEIEIDN